jgi:enoyl-CoA hydratase/carnithine racemase
LRLNRPKALNSITLDMLDELERALDEIGPDRRIQAVVVSGNGRAFSTGADLKTVRELFERWSDYIDYLYRLATVFQKVEKLPVPTIARIHGFALAGGLELLLCCDMAIAAEDARIGDQHANFGLIAGAGGIPRLTRRVGRAEALEILYTGRWLSGIEAAARRIVLRAVPEPELDAAVSALTDQLMDKSRASLSYMKRAVLAGEDVPLQTALNEERAALIEYFTTSSEPREGVSAFTEKRSPNFNG